MSNDDDSNIRTETEINISFALPVVFGFLSLIGSSTIVYMLLRKRKTRKGFHRRYQQNNNNGNKKRGGGVLATTYDRLLFGMSIMDIFSSTAVVLSTLPSPKDSTPDSRYENWEGYGTTTTCTIQGFFYYVGMNGTTLYYCVLCVYYAIVIRKNHNNRNSAMLNRRNEVVLHSIPIVYCFVTGIFLAVSENFNNAATVCWISYEPSSCRDNPETCARGKNAGLYRILFAGIPIIGSFFVVLTCMIILISNVRKQERKMIQYKFQNNNNNNNDQHNYYTTASKSSINSYYSGKDYDSREYNSKEYNVSREYSVDSKYSKEYSVSDSNFGSSELNSGLSVMSEQADPSIITSGAPGSKNSQEELINKSSLLPKSFFAKQFSLLPLYNSHKIPAPPPTNADSGDERVMPSSPRPRLIRNVSSNNRTSRKLRETTNQGMLYIGVYFLTFIFAIINQLHIIITGKVIWQLFLLQQATAPAQGFFNFLVFIRPQVSRLRRKKGGKRYSWCSAFWEVIFQSSNDSNKNNTSNRSMLSKDGEEETNRQQQQQYQYRRSRFGDRKRSRENLNSNTTSRKGSSTSSLLSSTSNRRDMDVPVVALAGDVPILTEKDIDRIISSTSSPERTMEFITSSKDNSKDLTVKNENNEDKNDDENNDESPPFDYEISLVDTEKQEERTSTTAVVSTSEETTAVLK